MKFSFLARCGDQTLPLEVETPFKPGRQVQRARRLAVGELLAVLELEHATVDATGEDMVRITTDDGIWVIAEGGSVNPPRRGGI